MKDCTLNKTHAKQRLEKVDYPEQQRIFITLFYFFCYLPNIPVLLVPNFIKIFLISSVLGKQLLFQHLYQVGYNCNLKP